MPVGTCFCKTLDVTAGEGGGGYLPRLPRTLQYRVMSPEGNPGAGQRVRFSGFCV